MTDTKKKIAWVTGASTGIGKATTMRLIKDGWHVSVTARSQDKLNEMAANNPQITAYPGDVTDKEAMAALVDSIEEELGPIDLALMNAGTYIPDDLENLDAAAVDDQFKINVSGTMYCLDPVLKRFRQRGKGHVAVVSSVAGYRGLPRGLAYGATKAALINFFEGLAIECRGTGIKVQVVCPGFIKTPLTDKNDFYMPMLMDVDVAADKLVKGLNSGAFEITFPKTFALMLKTIGLLPDRAYIWLLSKARP